jgi:hypothetical protein
MNVVVIRASCAYVVSVFNAKIFHSPSKHSIHGCLTVFFAKEKKIQFAVYYVQFVFDSSVFNGNIHGFLRNLMK